MGFFGFGSTAIRSTVITGKLALARFSVQQTEGLKVGCEGMGLRWLSRFKLTRLRRISLATLPRYERMGGRRNGWAVCEVWVVLMNGWVAGWVDGWV